MPEPFPSALSPSRERLRRLMERYRATEIAPRDAKKQKYEITAGEAEIHPAEQEALYEITAGMPIIHPARRGRR